MDWAAFAVYVMAGLFAMYSARLIVRAVAARIAGPNAALALAAPSINIPITIYTALPHLQEIETDQDIDGETGNTETRETLGNSAGNSIVAAVSPDELPLNVSDNGAQKLLPRMTHEEREELLGCRNDALILLSRCADYYKATGEPDLGTIPRYDAIHMKAQYRQAIVNNLEYSGVVSKTKNKTFVVPEIGTCAALFEAVRANKRRVYPVGYTERQYQRYIGAAMALPENKRDE